MKHYQPSSLLRCNVKKLTIVVDGHLIGLMTLTDIARTARIELQMVDFMKELSKGGWLPAIRKQKVLDCYMS